MVFLVCFFLKGYEVIHIDALYRHGTRYPKKEKATRWKATLQKLSLFGEKNMTTAILKVR